MKKDFILAFTYLLGLFLLGVITLFSFSAPSSLAHNESLFHWPKDMSLKLKLDGTLQVQDISPFEQKGGSYPFYLELFATPLEALSHSLFSLNIKKAVIQDQNGMLLIDYDQTSNDQLRYRIDSRLSDNTRNKIVDLLKINTSSRDILEDHSLLRQSLKIAFTDNGQILEFSLSPEFKKMLSENLNTHPFFSLIESLVVHPEKMAPLGPSFGKSSWETSGNCVIPIQFQHKKLNDYAYQSSGFGTKTLSDASINQKWNIDWELSENGHIPSLVKLSFQMDHQEKHFSSSSNQNLDLNVRISIDELAKKPAVEIVSIEDEFRF